LYGFGYKLKEDKRNFQKNCESKTSVNVRIHSQTQVMAQQVNTSDSESEIEESFQFDLKNRLNSIKNVEGVKLKSFLEKNEDNKKVHLIRGNITLVLIKDKPSDLFFSALELKSATNKTTMNKVKQVIQSKGELFFI